MSLMWESQIASLSWGYEPNMHVFFVNLKTNLQIYRTLHLFHFSLFT